MSREKESELMSPTERLGLWNYTSINDEKGGGIPGDIGGVPSVEWKGTLGMFEGVFVPCSLCIFGVILYQRLGWIVAQVGFGYYLLMLIISYAVVIPTVLSLSALSTNGFLRGGGAYYLVSRAMGPELGGAIGVIFYAANVSGCVVYLLGFSAELCDLVYGEGNYGDWSRILWALVGLLGVTVVIYIGPELYAKTAVTAFCITVIVLSLTFLSFCIGLSDAEGYTGVKSSTFDANWTPNYSDNFSFPTVFSIFFPAVTGIMAGANMSGVLKNPSKSIPKGTLLATIGSIFVYFGFAIIIAASNESDVINSTKQGYTVMRRVSVFAPSVSTGVFIAVLLSTMGTQMGAAQILQALATDELFPFLWPFRAEDGAPPTIKQTRRSIIITFIIIAIIILSGADLNTMATFQTLFFLLSYAIINMTCFTLSVQGSPNFRPIWRYYSWHVSGAGFAGCLAIMFYAHPLRAAIALVLCMALVAYIMWSGSGRHESWGDVTQSLIFHQVRKFLLRLDERKQHVKYWRPHILLLADNPSSQYRLIHLANNLKKGGVLFLADIREQQKASPLSVAKVQNLEERRLIWTDLIRGYKLKAFPFVTTASSTREGMRHMLELAGLGALRPNSVLLEFQEDARPTSTTASSSSSSPSSLSSTRLRKWIKDVELLEKTGISSSTVHDMEISDYLTLLRDVRLLGHNVLIARHIKSLPHYLVDGGAPEGKTSKQTSYMIDVWCFDHPVGSESKKDGMGSGTWRESVELSLLLGWILSRCRGSVSGWSKYATFRVCAVVDTASEVPEKETALKHMLMELRISWDHLNVVAAEDYNEKKGTDLQAMTVEQNLSRIIQGESSETALAIVPVSNPFIKMTRNHPKDSKHYDLEAGSEFQAWWQRLRELTKGTCPVILCQSNSSPIMREL